MKTYQQPYMSYIDNKCKGCLIFLNGEIVLIKKVVVFSQNALIIYSLARDHRKIRLAWQHLNELFLFYYNPNVM